ncbi:MAG: hypothetical protein RIR14_1020, partial [Pseudomonadota bacterium]
AGRMKRKDALDADVRSRPPFLILTGAEDHLLASDETNLAAAALSQARIPAMRVLMAGTGHGFSDVGLAAARDFLKSVIQENQPFSTLGPDEKTAQIGREGSTSDPSCPPLLRLLTCRLSARARAAHQPLGSSEKTGTKLAGAREPSVTARLAVSGVTIQIGGPAWRICRLPSRARTAISMESLP